MILFAQNRGQKAIGETGTDCNTGHVATVAPLPSREVPTKLILTWIFLPLFVHVLIGILSLQRLGTWLKYSKKTLIF